RTDPRPAVATGLFSADLYHACALGLLSLPALSERREDIPVLAQHLLFETATRHGKTVRGFNNEALAFLTRYDWPGNLRELENEVTRMLIFSQDRILGPDLISRHILQATSGPHDADADAVLVGDGPLRARVEEIEKRILREVLTRLKWNKTRAAEELGLSRVGLRAKLDRYGLAPGCVPVLEGEV
ncbi:MAG: helix-turn-helix domain-containing protein, partial [Pseudomonadota bacterium]